MAATRILVDAFALAGQYEHSYYLLHSLALRAAFLVLAAVFPPGNYGSWVFWTLMPPMFALTLVPSAILFLVVERPFSLVPRRKGSKGPKSSGDCAANPSVTADHTQAGRRAPPATP